MGLSLITDAGQNFEQIFGAGPVEGILADVFEPEDAFFVDEVDGRDILFDLASSPFRGEKAQTFGDGRVRIDQDGE